jgi:hypothetical protein
MPLADPDVVIPVDRSHPVPVSRVAHADLADGIRA